MDLTSSILAMRYTIVYCVGTDHSSARTRVLPASGTSFMHASWYICTLSPVRFVRAPHAHCCSLRQFCATYTETVATATSGQLLPFHRRTTHVAHIPTAFISIYEKTHVLWDIRCDCATTERHTFCNGSALTSFDTICHCLLPDCKIACHRHIQWHWHCLQICMSTLVLPHNAYTRAGMYLCLRHTLTSHLPPNGSRRCVLLQLRHKAAVLAPHDASTLTAPQTPTAW